MAYLSPKDVVVELLRKNLTDPRSRNTTSDSDSFTATASQTEFTLTPSSGSLSFVSSVTVNAVAQTKWQDYWIDHKNSKVIFFTGLSLNDAVVVSYNTGSTDWIYPDKPYKTLSSTAFPRMNVMLISGSGERLGRYDASVETSLHLQIDVWTKEKADGQVFTIDSRGYTGDDLAEYLAWQVVAAFEDNEDELIPALYNFELLQPPRDIPFDVDMQAFHKVVEVSVKGLKVGRTS